MEATPCESTRGGFIVGIDMNQTISLVPEKVAIIILMKSRFASKTAAIGSKKAISDVLPYSRLWYAEPNAIRSAIGFAKFFSRSHDAVIRVYDEAGNVIETHEHIGHFKEW